MHVTSNPYFAFHDDVFPAFAKNAVAQPRFPVPSTFSKTIIPGKFKDKIFSSLDELKHISTVEIDLSGKKKFEFKIDFPGKFHFHNDKSFLKFEFFDGTTILEIGIINNGSIWMDSDYFDERFTLNSTVSELTDLAFSLSSNNSVESAFVEVFEEKFDLIDLSALLIS